MSDGVKSFFLPGEIHQYVLAQSEPLGDVQRSLIRETEALGFVSIMQIAPEQGAFMAMLARLMGAKRAIEVGTFTGYSALCVAEALPEDGKLLCCDVSDQWTSVGLAHWERAKVAGRIDLRIAPAIETLRSLPPDADWDMAFIDADKESYIDYFEEIVPRLRPGGLLLVDNVLWFGKVIDPSVDDDETNAIRAFNAHALADQRVEVVMLPLSDGLTLVRKR